jgi:hypothetical protein
MNHPEFQRRALGAVLYGSLTVAVLMCLAGEYGYAAFVVVALAVALAASAGRERHRTADPNEEDA